MQVFKLKMQWQTWSVKVIFGNFMLQKNMSMELLNIRLVSGDVY